MSKRMETGVDRISDLPDNVREQILMSLPLRDAAKASVWSSKWRNMWAYLPCLVFDQSLCPMIRGSRDHNAVTNKLMLNLCTILFLHRGPLREVSLSLPVLRSFPDHMERILMFLQEKPIDSLTITLERQYRLPSLPPNKIERYKLPRRMFSSFSRLKTLHLCCCEVKLPPVSFDGFSMLTVLKLRNVKFNDEHSSIPWSFKCPLLSALTMDDCVGLSEEPDIVVEAPKLSHFHFDGKFGSLHLKHTSLLKTVVLNKQFPLSEHKIVDPSQLLQLCSGFAAVKSLSVSGHFYQYLARGNQVVDLSPWEMLKHMTLDEVFLSRRCDVWSALYMITKAPNMQRLTISTRKNSNEMSDASTSAEMGRLVEDGKFRAMIIRGFGHRMGQLKRVEVKKLNGIKSEMTFIRWLLNSSPALGKMEIQLSPELSAAEKMSILTALNGFERISSRARIIIT